MENKLTKNSWWNQAGGFLLPLLIALTFFAFTFSYYPFQEKLQFDTDEGLNLMRSMLVALGHPLYSEVSSDQPPLFNQILAVAFRIAGPDVNVARGLVLLFSTMLVWACAQFLELTWGKLAALLFLPLIIMTPRYLNLSVAVMIGLPSIALAAVSMVFVGLWHQRRNDRWLVLSGVLLALSVLIKFFTGFLVPIFLIGLTISAYFHARGEKRSWRILRPGLIWGLSFAGVAALLTVVLVGPQNLWLIIYPHVMAPSQEYFQAEGYSMNLHLQPAGPLLILGLLGGLVSVYKRNWLALYPLAWAAVAYLLFSFYSPVFYHHQLLITVPMAILAAIPVAEAAFSLVATVRSPVRFRFETLLGIAVLVGFALISVPYLQSLDKELLNRPRIREYSLSATSGKLRVLDAMNQYIDETHWIMTDVPIYAFRVHRPVPPNLATISQKRLSTGSLTEADILAAMNEYQPEQVLIARFSIPALEEYLQQNYTLIMSPEYFRLFLRNDLVPSDH